MKPLWVEMLEASDRAIEGREFDDLRYADQVIMEAQILALQRWINNKLPNANLSAILAQEATFARNGRQDCESVSIREDTRATAWHVPYRVSIG